MRGKHQELLPKQRAKDKAESTKNGCRTQPVEELLQEIMHKYKEIVPERFLDLNCLNFSGSSQTWGASLEKTSPISFGYRLIYWRTLSPIWTKFRGDPVFIRIRTIFICFISRRHYLLLQLIPAWLILYSLYTKLKYNIYEFINFKGMNKNH